MAMAIFSDPIRTLRSGPASQLMTGLALALVLALGSIVGYRLIAQIESDRGIAPLANSEDVQVNGIEVNVTGTSGDDARLKGWKLAQRIAWERLGGPKLPENQIDAMVSAIVVEKEMIGPRRYIATLGVIFDRAKASQYIGVSASVTTRSAPLLVIPVLYSGGVRQVYEVRGPWQRAWASYQMSSSPIDYIRPSGAGGESLILNAGQPGRRSRIWWNTILGQFDASDVLIPAARLERQWPGGPVHGTFTARYGPDNRFLDSFKLTAKDEAGVPDMLKEAIRRIDLIYQKALADGLLKPDPTLVTNEMAFERVMAELRQRLLAGERQKAAGAEGGTASASPETTTSVPESVMVATYTVQFASPDAAAVDVALASVRGGPGVQAASSSSIAIGGTSVMQVRMAGSLDSLAAHLRSQGWQVSAGSNVIRISR